MGNQHITHEKKECDGKNQVKYDTGFGNEGFNFFFCGHIYLKCIIASLGVKPNLLGRLHLQSLTLFLISSMLKLMRVEFLIRLEGQGRQSAGLVSRRTSKFRFAETSSTLSMGVKWGAEIKTLGFVQVSAL